MQIWKQMMMQAVRSKLQAIRQINKEVMKVQNQNFQEEL